MRPWGNQPWVGCRHHLALEVSAAGSIALRSVPGVRGRRIGLPAGRPPGVVEFAFIERVVDQLDELDESAATCALDEADEGGLSLEEVGQRMGITRERVRQIEVSGLEKIGVDSMAAFLATEEQ